jgi:hypothetical protein
VVIFASCLSVIWRVLFSVYQTSFLSLIFTSFILGFVQEVISLLFGEFYSLCYFTSFGLGFGEFTLEHDGAPYPRIVVLALVERTSRTYDAINYELPVGWAISPAGGGRRPAGDAPRLAGGAPRPAGDAPRAAGLGSRL